MSSDAPLVIVFDRTRRNALLAWLVVSLLFVISIERVYAGRPRTAALGFVVIALAVAVPVYARSVRTIAPWDLLVVAAFPVFLRAVVGDPFRTEILFYVAIAAIALLAVATLHVVTALRLTHWFAIVLVSMMTLAAAALWNIVLWGTDRLFGTTYLLDGRSQDAINATVMIECIYATIAGIVAGVAFTYFFRYRTLTSQWDPAVELDSDVHRMSRIRLADRIGLAESRQRQLTQLMQVSLVGVLLYGLFTLDLPTITNAAVALAITFLPGLLERNLELPMDPGLTLWIVLAVFLHALGSAGVYDLVSPWDFLTHALSASVVAAGGYAAFRAIDLHTPAVRIPGKFMVIFLFIFVLAVGVVWEILEFAIDQFALWVGIPAVLAQHGIDDTILDLVFNMIGAAVTAIWGTVYLTDVSTVLAERISEARQSLR